MGGDTRETSVARKVNGIIQAGPGYVFMIRRMKWHVV